MKKVTKKRLVLRAFQTLGIAAFRTQDNDIAQAVLAERRRWKSGTPRAWAEMPVSNALPALDAPFEATDGGTSWSRC